MTIHVHTEALFILNTLQKAGYEAYIVGGAVRDMLLHQGQDDTQPYYDIDFTTNATPEQIMALFPESFYENQFGTVSITPEHIREMIGRPIAEITLKAELEKNRIIDVTQATKIHVSLSDHLPSSQKNEVKTKLPPNYEITTFRSDGVYHDHRRPKEVTWGKTLEEDLARRDFTINAMAIAIPDDTLKKIFASGQTLPVIQDFTENEYQLIDPFKGKENLTQHLIHTVGDPEARFGEDALRMLRAIRFSVQLNMRMSDEVFAAISLLAPDIQHVSWERIRDEFLKMLTSDYPAEAIELLDETGILHYILPELREGKGVEQGGHHTTDVWTHSLDALRNCPSSDPIVRFATLLHDVAKPRTYRFDGGSKPTFYNHEIVGSRMARQIAQRFHLSKREIERIFTLVRFHMFSYQTYHTDAAIRRFMRNVGLENIDDILDLREGDRLGSGARKTSWRLEEMKERMISQLHQPFAITDLAINGTDLIQELQLKPSPVIGNILKTLFQEVLENPELNQKETLMKRAKELLPQ